MVANSVICPSCLKDFVVASLGICSHCYYVGLAERPTSRAAQPVKCAIHTQMTQPCAICPPHFTLPPAHYSPALTCSPAQSGASNTLAIRELQSAALPVQISPTMMSDLAPCTPPPSLFLDNTHQTPVSTHMIDVFETPPLPTPSLPPYMRTGRSASRPIRPSLVPGVSTGGRASRNSGRKGGSGGTARRKPVSEPARLMPSVLSEIPGMRLPRPVSGSEPQVHVDAVPGEHVLPHPDEDGVVYGAEKEWTWVTKNPLNLDSDKVRLFDELPERWTSRFRTCKDRTKREELMNELIKHGESLVAALKKKKCDAYYLRMKSICGLSTSTKRTIRGRIHMELNKFSAAKIDEMWRDITRWLTNEVTLG